MNLNKFAHRTQFLVSFGYLGHNFYGVQEQPKLNTVLGALRKRIETSSSQRAKALMISARTDRFVSCLQNYATFWLKNPIDLQALILNVEAGQNDGLFGVSIKVVGPHVNARGCSASKYYRYSIIDDCDAEILTDHELAWRIAPKLSLQSMQDAAQIIEGKQDFSSFRAAGCTAFTPIKNIFYIKIAQSKAGYIFIDIEADAFLRKMIRNIVGLLVEVGSGLRKTQDIKDILLQKNRQAAGITAPALGLMLMKVNLNILY